MIHRRSQTRHAAPDLGRAQHWTDLGTPCVNDPELFHAPGDNWDQTMSSPFPRQPYGTAVISNDGVYRYWLFRRWAGSRPAALFVMLNPSTADGTTDDPTIRRCMRFALSWGCAGIAVCNLYAYRTAYPAALWKAEDPVGPLNDEHLEGAAVIARDTGAPVIAAWGANARPDRVARVLELDGMERLRVFGLTKDGHPRHPLYVRGTVAPVRWEVPE